MAFVLKLCGYTNGNQLAKKKQKKNMVSPLHFYHNKTMVYFTWEDSHWDSHYLSFVTHTYGVK